MVHLSEKDNYDELLATEICAYTFFVTENGILYFVILKIQNPQFAKFGPRNLTSEECPSKICPQLAKPQLAWSECSSCHYNYTQFRDWLDAHHRYNHK